MIKLRQYKVSLIDAILDFAKTDLAILSSGLFLHHHLKSGILTQFDLPKCIYHT